MFGLSSSNSLSLSREFIAPPAVPGIIPPSAVALWTALALNLSTMLRLSVLVTVTCALACALIAAGQQQSQQQSQHYCRISRHHQLCRRQPPSPACGRLLQHGSTPQLRQMVLHLHNMYRSKTARGGAMAVDGSLPPAAAMMELVSS